MKEWLILMKIKVGGVYYTIEEKPFIEIDGNKNYAGSCTYTKTRIELLETLSNDRKEQTFIHELMHAILNEAGYAEHDEDLVERISIVLHQVINENDLKRLLKDLNQ